MSEATLGRSTLFTLKIWDFQLTFWPQTSDFWRPVEDGSNTQYRLAVIESLIPPRSDGPIVHFHEMHDEGFFVTVSITVLVYTRLTAIEEGGSGNCILILIIDQEEQGALPRPGPANSGRVCR